MTSQSTPEERYAKRVEDGRKGGQTTAKRYGDDFFQRIGRLGGRKGGLTTAERYGREHYSEIGRRGGLRGKEDR